MSIEVQIKLVVSSILFGFSFMILYSLINEFFYKSKLRILFDNLEKSVNSIPYTTSNLLNSELILSILSNPK